MILYSLDQLQLWKLDGSTLRNKANIWQSNSSWKFSTNDDGKMIYIHHIDSERVLETNHRFNLGAAVTKGTLVKDDPVRSPSQLWIKGTPDSEGYFTLLENFEYPKYLTAILWWALARKVGRPTTPEHGLEVLGK